MLPTTEGEEERASLTATGDNIGTSVSATSYQKEDSSAATRQRPNTGASNNIITRVLHGAFSVDEEGDNKGHPVASFQNRRALSCTKLTAWASLLLVAVGIGVMRHLSSQPQHAPTTINNTTVDSSDAVPEGVCGGPVQALRPESVLDNLQTGAVAADHPICSKMGLYVLQQLQGNAVDAAVTVALCLGVANPASSGLGGGAFLLVHADEIDRSARNMPDFIDARDPGVNIKTGNKVTEVIDCREVAPAAATQDMFHNLPPLASVRGGLAIGVPGELKGLELAHARHGKLKWSEVVQPALELAQEGVTINANLAHEINIQARKYRMEKNLGQDFGLRAILTHNDNWHTPRKEGEKLYNTVLAETLKAVRDGGSDALYKGQRAADLAADIQQEGGITTKEDIESYRATLRTPVVAHDISGFSIVGVPPPSSGGATIVGAARYLAGFTTPLASFPETLSRHRMVEALKHAFGIRMSLSDPNYDTETVKDAMRDLLAGSYMEELRISSHDSRCLPLSQYGGTKWSQLKDADGKKDDVRDADEGDRLLAEGILFDTDLSDRFLEGRRFGHLNDHGTSHFVVVDQDDNAVSMTTSVNTYFGSNVLSETTGIVLSNTMDDFSNPGRPNYFGLHPSPANYVAPGKKPLSSMSPTMVFRRYKERGTGQVGSLMLVLGGSGGPKIISAVLSVIVNYVLLGMPLFEAVIRERLHDQLIYHGAAVTTCENTVLQQGPLINVTARTREALRRRGHDLLDVNYEGTVQAIAIDQEDGSMTAVCDVRKGGSPAGY